MKRTRVYCTNKECLRYTQSYMRRIGPRMKDKCSLCGFPCEPTTRLPGGQRTLPENATVHIQAYITPEQRDYLEQKFPCVSFSHAVRMMIEENRQKSA